MEYPNQKYYERLLKEEYDKQVEKESFFLSTLKTNCSEEFFRNILLWISDEDNGINGGYEFIKTPKGSYENLENEGNYWEVLKGMWIEQTKGVCDDYYGTLAIKLENNTYLQVDYYL